MQKPYPQNTKLPFKYFQTPDQSHYFVIQDKLIFNDFSSELKKLTSLNPSKIRILFQKSEIESKTLTQKIEESGFFEEYRTSDLSTTFFKLKNSSFLGLNFPGLLEIDNKYLDIQRVLPEHPENMKLLERFMIGSFAVKKIENEFVFNSSKARKIEEKLLDVLNQNQVWSYVVFYNNSPLVAFTIVILDDEIQLQAIGGWLLNVENSHTLKIDKLAICFHLIQKILENNPELSKKTDFCFTSSREKLIQKYLSLGFAKDQDRTGILMERVTQ